MSIGERLLIRHSLFSNRTPECFSLLFALRSCPRSLFSTGGAQTGEQSRLFPAGLFLAEDVVHLCHNVAMRAYVQTTFVRA